MRIACRYPRTDRTAKNKSQLKPRVQEHKYKIRSTYSRFYDQPIPSPTRARRSITAATTYRARRLHNGHGLASYMDKISSSRMKGFQIYDCVHIIEYSSNFN